MPAPSQADSEDSDDDEEEEHMLIEEVNINFFT